MLLSYNFFSTRALRECRCPQRQLITPILQRFTIWRVSLVIHITPKIHSVVPCIIAVSFPPGECSAFLAAGVNQYNSAFFVPASTYYCWVDWGSMEWEVCLTLLLITSSENPSLFNRVQSPIHSATCFHVGPLSIMLSNLRWMHHAQSSTYYPPFTSLFICPQIRPQPLFRIAQFPTRWYGSQNAGVECLMDTIPVS